MIEIFNLDKSYFSKILFSNVNLNIPTGIKVSIIGKNGSGKSTLFKMIIGEEKVDNGKISFSKNKPEIGYMKQELIATDETTILDYLKNESGLLFLELELRKLEKNLSNQEFYKKYSNVYEEFEKLGGYSFEYEATKILDSLGLNFDYGEKKVNQLSSGQKSKILLTSAILRGKDILLLDEPTNNLDSKSINFLKKFIINSSATVLIISHNRDLIDNTCNKIYEIDDKKSSITEFSGTYSEFEIYKQKKFDRELLEYEVRQEEIDDLKQAEKEVRLRMENVVKKKPRDNDKGLYNFFLDKATMSHGTKARILSERIKKIDNLEKPTKDKKIVFTLNDGSNFGYIRVNDLEFIRDDFSLNIKKFEALKNDRIAILGDNGSGKTTFLDILNNRLLPGSGEVYISKNIKIGNFTQEHESLPKDMTPIELIKKDGNLNEIEANKILSIFNLNYTERYKKIRILSPGQRAKLLLVLFRLKDYNTLILDEPTNHIDLEAVEVLEKALSDFDGILLVVSHDKRFLDNLSINKTYLIENGLMSEVFDN